MSLHTLASMSGALATLVVASVAFTPVIQDLVCLLLKRKAPQRPYSDRLAELTGCLSQTSREVGSVLAEITRVANDRTQTVQQLETDLATMGGREKELKRRIEALEQTPLAVAELFAKLVAPGEKRSAKPDYMLFGAGVVISTGISIAIQVFVG